MINHLGKNAVEKACDWYIETARDKFPSNFLADIRKRAIELDYPDSTIIEDGVQKHLACTIDGKPVYRTVEETQRKLEAYGAAPAVPRITSGEARQHGMDRMSYLAGVVKSTEPSQIDIAEQQRQIEELRKMANQQQWRSSPS